MINSEEYFKPIIKGLQKSMKAQVGDTVKLSTCEYEHHIRNVELVVNYHVYPYLCYLRYYSKRKTFVDDEIIEVLKR